MGMVRSGHLAHWPLGCSFEFSFSLKVADRAARKWKVKKADSLKTDISGMTMTATGEGG
jgi:hypothetical protein